MLIASNKINTIWSPKQGIIVHAVDTFDMVFT